MAPLDWCAVAVGAAGVGGFCAGYVVAGSRWYREWKAGFDRGYALGKQHGHDAARFVRGGSWDDRGRIT